jgi:hypothetical protein
VVVLKRLFAWQASSTLAEDCGAGILPAVSHSRSHVSD